MGNKGSTSIRFECVLAYRIFGMFFYLARDVLVRVFSALGDGEVPAKVSVINIFLNALLDYF